MKQFTTSTIITTLIDIFRKTMNYSGNIENFNDLSAQISNDGYNVIEVLDLDPENKFDNHRYNLIGPEDKELSKIIFYEFNGDFGKQGIPIYKKTGNQITALSNLKPQEYILVRTVLSSNIPINKMTFNVDYQPGKYEFADNLKNGINDKITLQVSRTLMSFLAK